MTNDSDDTARTLIPFMLGMSHEQFCPKLNEIFTSGRELSPPEWDEFDARHDQYMVRDTC